jgi:hypothetical protein
LDQWVTITEFPRLYNVTFTKFITVSRIEDEGWGVVRFRRTLHGETAEQWTNLKNLVYAFQLNDEPDRLNWTTRSIMFTIKSLYLQLRSDGVFPYRFM